MNGKNSIIVLENIKSKVFIIRGVKVILDKDLAEFYGVKTKALNQAVKRNISRFPSDFLFKLTMEEAKTSRSQNVTLEGKGSNIKYLPYAFTRDGVSMLSSVLKSEKAIQINIAIMRALGDLSESLEARMITRKEFEEIKKQVFIDKDRITANYWSIMYILRNLPKQLKENNQK